MSGRPCSTCSDPRRPEVDAAIVAGQSFRVIARQFAPLSHDAIRRHRPHVGTALVKAAERRKDAEAESLLSKVERLEADARRLGEKAETEGDLRCALAAVRELLDVVKLQREMTAPSKRPEPTAADAQRFAEKLAADVGCSAEELLCEAHELANRCEGEQGSPLVLGAIAAAAEAARTGLKADLA